MSTNSLQTVRKGRSLPFVFDRGGDSIGGWICTIKVKQYPGDAASIDRVIAPVGLTWPGFLTSTETAALASLGSWTLFAEINNATEDRTEYPIIRFHVAEAL